MLVNSMFYMEFTWLTIVSVVLTVVWAGLRIAGKKKSMILFLLAYVLWYVDYFVMKEHFNFEVMGMMLGIAALVAVVQFLRYKKKMQYSKELAIYVFLSVVHGFLYFFVSI